jgi:hypothetical protein
MTRFRIIAVAVLAGVLLFALATLGAAAPGDGATANQYAYGKSKVTVCHKGKTTEVPAPAAQSHFDHGDTPGPCPGS